MYLYNTLLGIIFFFQTGVGVLGNSFFFCFYGFPSLSSHRSRPMELILVQLTVANTIMLLLHGCPLAIFFLGKGPFLGNAGCKMVFYLRRVSRGFSICSTWLLSVFQAVTISPCSSRLVKFKVRILKSVKPSCLVCWMVSIIIEVYVPIYITELKSNNSSHRDGLDLFYCYWAKAFKELSILPTLRDIFFVVGMVCTSGYMVFLLCRHHQNVQHIHSTCLSPRTFPEVKATQSILLLVGIFVSTYFVSCTFALYKVYVTHAGAWMMIMNTFIGLCFPAISPFLLIHKNTVTSQAWCIPWQSPRHYFIITARICESVHLLFARFL
ncbi:vomeronasal type-1 receptor 1-like [Sarcophilus harrisii]